MAYSRVSRLEEKRARKQFLIVIASIIGILLVVGTIGIPLMAGASVLLGNLKSRQPLVEGGDKTPPFPPILTPTTSATNSATLKLEGYGEPESTLTIFVNDQEMKKVLIGSDGNFSFTDINLVKGKNEIFATATDQAGNASTPSTHLVIIYIIDSPKLEIFEPTDGQTFAKNQQEIIIKGTTDPGNDIHINGRFVSVKDDGAFMFNLRLNDGENTLSIVARDQAGNETKLERKVTYTP